MGLFPSRSKHFLKKLFGPFFPSRSFTTLSVFFCELFFWHFCGCFWALFWPELKTDVLLLLPNPIYSQLECRSLLQSFSSSKSSPEHETPIVKNMKKNHLIFSRRATGWNVEVWREIEQLSDILHFSLEMTNHPISFQRGAILPNLDPQNNFPISKCYIGFKYETNMIQIWHKYETNMKQIWCKYDTNMIKIWYKYDTNMIQINTI